MNAQTDVLSDVLSSLRICGSLLLHESYLPPWGISIPAADQLNPILGIEPGVRVVAFHLVERGHIEITLADEKTSVVEAGEMVICFGGNCHQISQGIHPPVLPLELFMQDRHNPFRSENIARTTAFSLCCSLHHHCR